MSGNRVKPCLEARGPDLSPRSALLASLKPQFPRLQKESKEYIYLPLAADRIINETMSPNLRHSPPKNLDWGLARSPRCTQLLLMQTPPLNVLASKANNSSWVQSVPRTPGTASLHQPRWILCAKEPATHRHGEHHPCRPRRATTYYTL